MAGAMPDLSRPKIIVTGLVLHPVKGRMLSCILIGELAVSVLTELDVE